MGLPRKCNKLKSKPCRCTIENKNTSNPKINITIPTLPTGSNGLLTEFVADIPDFTGPVQIPSDVVGNVELANIMLSIDNLTDRVWLNSTVGWVATEGEPLVRFFITRTRPGGTEEEIVAARFTAEAVEETTTSFTFVDNTPILTEGPQLIVYRLRAEIVATGTAFATTPVILTGAEIKANSPS